MLMSAMSIAGDWIGVIPFTAFAIGISVWQIRWSRGVLEVWAAREGLELVASDHRLFETGPFFPLGWGSRSIFRVEAKDREGKPRDGWVCNSRPGR